MTNRRGFLATILATGMAPAAIGSGILMPVRQIILPWQETIRSILYPPDDQVWGRAFGVPSPEMQRAKNALMRACLDNIEIGRIERFDFAASPILPALTVKFRRPRR